MPITSRKIRVGVCAMDKKARSKAMTAILTRLEKFDEFSVVVFGDHTILNKPVEEWPVVDALLSWFSGGFPLGKAEKYASLHKGIYMVNDLHRQWDLLDRRCGAFPTNAFRFPVYCAVWSAVHPSRLPMLVPEGAPHTAHVPCFISNPGHGLSVRRPTQQSDSPTDLFLCFPQDGVRNPERTRHPDPSPHHREPQLAQQTWSAPKSQG
jgi:hypothetical protein